MRREDLSSHTHASAEPFTSACYYTLSSPHRQSPLLFLESHSRLHAQFSRMFFRYLMDGAESSSESDAEEEESEAETERAKTPEKRHVTSQKQPIKKEEDEYGGSTDAEAPEEVEEDSGMDTEDELNRVEMERKRKGSVADVKDEDPYGGSTDENTDAEQEEDKPIPELPGFLTGKFFYLYGTFPDNQKRQLQRYIIAFNGAVEDYMSQKVQFVVTSQGWDESFEDALTENGNLCFVKPSWILAINDRQKMLPYQPHTVVP